MTKKEIKIIFKNSKKSARKEYKKSLALIEDTYRGRIEEAERIFNDSIDDYYESRGKRKVVNPPKRSVLEEIGNSVTHGVGAIFAIVAFVLMLLKAESRVEYVSAVIYFAGMN